MKKRNLGNTEFQIAPLALGANVFGWTINQESSFQVLDAFVDLGFQFIDTANIYSTWVPGHKGGESETIIGNWLKLSGKRDKIVLATKVGMQMGDGSKGLKRENIIKSVEDSLRRLQTNTIDLYQSHLDDQETSLEETLEAYSTLLKHGKIRAIGASNYSAQRLMDALKVSKEKHFPLYVSLQPEYNLYDRSGFESELEALCIKEKLGVISYYSLASGFLTGKYRSSDDIRKSVRGPSIGAKYLNARGHKILAALDTVAKTHSTSTGAIALSWLMHRESITAPIASATSVEQLKEIAKAPEIKLSKDEINILGEASAE
ncbi:MAG: aldo/keto reductase [Oligoflexia bacterium]|nr:aldo/keto reductase [Oligoflexia bacterium]